ncbi:MAG: hypothetical protein ACYC1D_18985 [Acidimicrobiales bacterium]
MAEQRQVSPVLGSSALTIHELARLYRAEEINDPKELAADIWESDEEMDEFLADLRSSRDASLA